ncbi:MAG: thioredoxin family protein [Acidobacteriota bacterium]|nr:thioredoxin family protein [Acidobacteriota bacterium]
MHAGGEALRRRHRWTSPRALAAFWALALSLVLFAGLPAGDADAQFHREEKATVELLAHRDSYAPGSTLRLATLVTVESGWHINSDQPTLDYLIPTEIQLLLPEGWPAPRITFPEAHMLEFSFVDEPIAVYEGAVPILAELELPAELAGDAASLRAEVRYQACNDTQCLPPVTSAAELTLVLGGEGALINQSAFGDSEVSAADLLRSSRQEPQTAASGAEPTTSDSAGASAADATEEAAVSSSGTGAGFVAMLLLAVLGGLILNVMPCVLPVLSLKVFGLVKSAQGGRKEAVRGGVMTSLGILVSFWALALAAVIARAAGSAVGWGVQFQEPGFVAFLAVIVVLFSLNLWGVFEIPLPARLTNRLTGGGKAGGSGAAGHFGSGLFATLMATPCSAPFLGTAISFALSRSSWEIFAIFTAVGLGMALPYLALAVAPGTAKLLPKPGPWMETVRGLMGFLLAAAAIWLFFVLAGQLPSARVAFVQLAMLLVALFVWLGSRLTRRRWLATTGLLAAAVLAIGLASGSTADPEAIQWRPFDEAEAIALAEAGTPVFVDVTADWCLTCKANEQLVLARRDIATAFADHGVVAMKADWTNYDDAITDLLQRHGRTGIPFYLLYRPDQPPHVFGELLTQEAILTAVREAGGTGGQVAGGR